MTAGCAGPVWFLGRFGMGFWVGLRAWGFTHREVFSFPGPFNSKRVVNTREVVVYGHRQSQKKTPTLSKFGSYKAANSKEV